MTIKKRHSEYKHSGFEAAMRHLWAHQHRRWFQPQWNTVLFSDENRFNLSQSDGRVRIWRAASTRSQDPNIVEVEPFGGGSVMVWGGISAETKTPLVVIRGNLNAECYLTELLVPLFQNNTVSIFQQDNAHPHTARICWEYLEQNNNTVLPWPARSPDLSPIEHLWDILGRPVKAIKPPTIEILSNVLVEE